MYARRSKSWFREWHPTDTRPFTNQADKEKKPSVTLTFVRRKPGKGPAEGCPGRTTGLPGSRRGSYLEPCLETMLVNRPKSEEQEKAGARKATNDLALSSLKSAPKAIQTGIVVGGVTHPCCRLRLRLSSPTNLPNACLMRLCLLSSSSCAPRPSHLCLSVPLSIASLRFYCWLTSEASKPVRASQSAAACSASIISPSRRS